MASPRVLIVDDEPAIRRTLRDLLEMQHCVVGEASDGSEGIETLSNESFDLVLLDLMMPRMDGMATLRVLRDRMPELPVIMLTAHATIETAVEATRLGAFDFLQKPPSLNRLMVGVRNALAAGRLATENRRIRSQLARSQPRVPPMIGSSRAMDRVRTLVEKSAPSDARVLITGEPGTGKEVVARWIHGLSHRADGPLVAVNCAAIPPDLIESELFGHEQGAFTGAVRRQVGTFEQADGGTLFLDEIGEMSAAAQSKVLRALETGCIRRVGGDRDLRIDVRIVCATNRDLDREMEEGRFREDLYHRVSVIQLHLPPLRERPEDIAPLASHFCSELSPGVGPRTLGDDALRALSTLPWRGNIRELRNAVERLLVLVEAEEISAADVDLYVTAGRRPSNSLEGWIDRFEHIVDFREDVERAFVERKLQQNDWNVSRTADAIDLQRSNLYARLKRYGLDRPE